MQHTAEAFKHTARSSTGQRENENACMISRGPRNGHALPCSIARKRSHTLRAAAQAWEENEHVCLFSCSTGNDKGLSCSIAQQHAGTLHAATQVRQENKHES
eukprot:1037683-Pelagomonas_calceolata.AAC.5